VCGSADHGCPDGEPKVAEALLHDSVASGSDPSRWGGQGLLHQAFVAHLREHASRRTLPGSRTGVPLDWMTDHAA